MLVLQIEYCSWFMIWSDIYYFLFWVGRWYLLITCVCTDPYLCIYFFVICGVQQTCRRLQLNRNSSQSSLHRISGWANASSLDWIFFFMSRCLEVLAWTRIFVYSSFLHTLSSLWLISFKEMPKCGGGHMLSVNHHLWLGRHSLPYWWRSTSPEPGGIVGEISSWA